MKVRKHLSAAALFSCVHQLFSKIKEGRDFSRNNKVTLSDCLMSGLALFSLKWPSLLAYDHDKRSPNIEKNLRSLFHVSIPPSDTYMRERLDEVDPFSIRVAFKKIWSKMQRSKLLESFRFLEQYYLITMDGTGVFSSNQVHCENCCIKSHYDGSRTYYHQMLGVALVHPDRQEVLPLCPEMIEYQDGSQKNDCERNAALRLVTHLRREHPHLPAVIVEDALADNAPHIKHLEAHNFKYIIVSKGVPTNALNSQRIQETDSFGACHTWYFANDLPLNGSHPELLTNRLEYTIEAPGRRKKTYGWVTNLRLTKNNVKEISRGGKARWKIENETFNTLKNQGYHFEHNYGHGKKNLCTILTFLMMLAFLIDQVQDAACSLYQAARKKARTKYALWERFRVLFEFTLLENWEALLSLIAQPRPLNTS